MSLFKSLIRKFIILRRFRNLKLSTQNFENCYITCSGKQDGAGAQALAILSTQLFAYDSGVTYVHTPFQKIEHNIKNDSNWEQSWESFFNLGLGTQIIEHLDQSKLKILQVDSPAQIQPGCSDCLYIVSQCHDYGNLFPDRFRSLQNIVQQKYHSQPKHDLRSHYNHCALNIALHVRRGDVQQFGQFAKRYTSNDSLIQLINNILVSLPPHSPLKPVI